MPDNKDNVPPGAREWKAPKTGDKVSGNDGFFDNKPDASPANNGEKNDPTDKTPIVRMIRP